MKYFKKLLVALSMTALAVFAGGCNNLQEQLCKHSYGEDVVTVAATCEEDGELSRECEKCGHVETETIAALGHTEETVAAQAPTCTESGWTEYDKCSVCDELLTVKKDLPALGHQIAILESVAPTCDENGWKSGAKCSVCDEIIVAPESIPALGHSVEVIPGYAATCESTGLTDGEKCSVCDAVLTVQAEIPATGHTLTYAYEDHQHWQVCDCGYETEKVNCLYMSEDEATAMSCVKYDAEKHWIECICGQELVMVDEGLTGPHWWENCEDSMCDFCGYTRESGNCVFDDRYDETQHWEECETCGYKTNTADHTLVDKYDETQHWQECTCGYKTDTVEHAVEIIPGYAATCTENGLTEGAKCSVCGLILSEQTTINAVHNYTMTYTDTTHTYACTACGDVNFSGLHEVGTYQHDETYHWQHIECTCGYIGEGEKLPHDKSYITGAHDETSHGVVCYTCEYYYSEAHTIVYNAIEGGHSLYCENCNYSLGNKNCVDEDGDSKCDLCGQDVELEATTYTEVDVVEGELAVGNVYRIYRSIASGTRLYLTGITCSVSAEEDPMYGSLYFGASSEADSLEYWFGAGWLGYKLEGIKVVQTAEYIDIYIEAGTYVLGGTATEETVTITIAEDATVASISGGVVKRLVATEE